MEVTYTSIPSLLQSCESIRARIAVIELILDGMTDAMLKATTRGHLEEYKLDTGQTRTDIRFRDMNNLVMAYNALVLRLDREYAKLGGRVNGRVFTLVDGKNLRGSI